VGRREAGHPGDEQPVELQRHVPGRRREQRRDEEPGAAMATRWVTATAQNKMIIAR
jgi:hypothetical protein